MYSKEELISAIKKYAPKANLRIDSRGSALVATIDKTGVFKFTPNNIVFIFNAAIEGEVPDLQRQPKSDVDNFVRACIEHMRKTPIPVKEEVQMIRRVFGPELKLVSKDGKTWMMYEHYSIYFTENKISLVQNDRTIEYEEFSNKDEFKEKLGVIRAVATQFENTEIVNSK